MSFLLQRALKKSNARFVIATLGAKKSLYIHNHKILSFNPLITPSIKMWIVVNPNTSDTTVLKKGRPGEVCWVNPIPTAY